MAQWVKDLVLSLLWLRSLLCCRFNCWPRNFHMPWTQPKKKKKNWWIGVPAVVQRVKDLTLSLRQHRFDSWCSTVG